MDVPPSDQLAAYDYELPTDLIAQHPLPNRTDARLLVVDRKRGALTHAHVRDLPDWLDPRDTLVLNDTRVVPARLAGYRTQTGGRWQGLFLSADEHGAWLVIGKTRGKLQPGETITLQDRTARDCVVLRLLLSRDDGTWVARPELPASDGPKLDVWTLLDEIGRVPLPPYIRGGEMLDSDRETYQTVYATHPGAVAAPTAGLHFTPELLARLRARGLETATVTLHVGLGTFRPIAAERLSEHVMHREWGRIDAATVERLGGRRAAGGRIVAVGTTSVRVLETASAVGMLQAWSGETDLFIRPPYAFRSVDALLTNFHLPKSTLLVLVQTFGGERLLREAYELAIRERYRFYSYGDAMLIL